MMNDLTQAAYLVTAILFILGMMRLRSPATARSGNALAAGGMGLALAVTLLSGHSLNGGIIGGGMAVGTILGVVAARKVRMTAMPQMVAIFNGMGGSDSLTVDFTNGSSVPTSGLSFDGGSGSTGNLLIIDGSGSADAVTLNANSVVFNKRCDHARLARHVGPGRRHAEHDQLPQRRHQPATLHDFLAW